MIFRARRRRLLEAALASTGLSLLPCNYASAQNRPAALLRASRQALALGNSSYQRNPLKNPVNDAKGIAGALTSMGFDVVSGFDLNQASMRDLIQGYLDKLTKTKAVGVFYFAGHGVQLGWRNYIVPVDARIAQKEAIRELCIDINTLIAGIRQAGNPMNVIVLDACRDNPFGRDVQPDQKGLSQLDAPPGTLLAYATAPGNTAADGEGAHGLYTEHLLREMRVPEAKIEDVFKRVRHAVRRASSGQQIPWESTSLEDDFWFIPPRELKTLAEAEIEREFKEELALWERASGSTSLEPLEDYLRRYPSGRFSELAQLKIDRLLEKAGEKRVQVVSSPENVYSKGTAKANTRFSVGDQFVYRTFDPMTKVESGRRVFTVTSVSEDQIAFNNGRMIADPLGNPIRSERERVVSTSRQFFVTEYSIGKRWSSRHFGTGRDGHQHFYDWDFRVVARESKTVPAGTFDAFRVAGEGWSSGTRLERTYWIAPDRVSWPIANELLVRNRRGSIVNSEGSELVSYQQSSA